MCVLAAEVSDCSQQLVHRLLFECGCVSARRAMVLRATEHLVNGRMQFNGSDLVLVVTERELN